MVHSPLKSWNFDIGITSSRLVKAIRMFSSVPKWYRKDLNRTNKDADFLIPNLLVKIWWKVVRLKFNYSPIILSAERRSQLYRHYDRFLKKSFALRGSYSIDYLSSQNALKRQEIGLMFNVTLKVRGIWNSPVSPCLIWAIDMY